MENKIDAKGVPDLILLEQVTEQAVFDTLTYRYRKDEIYTYIGDVVISVNPYKDLKNTTKTLMQDYKGRFKYERPPHIFALANDAYNHMLRNAFNQCIMISGESGAGKTEAAKIIMQYISEVSTANGPGGERIKKMLLESNPLLEAFGNAKTVRNDNSSRFGKYMEILFQYNGAPAGGRISVYMLEKSRIVNTAPGERNFHIFYQLLAGLEPNELEDLQLNQDPSCYGYLNKSNVYKVDGTNDIFEFQKTKTAMDILGFSQNEKQHVWNVLAAILHLGNVKFADNKVDPESRQPVTSIENIRLIDVIARLLSTDPGLIQRALLCRTIDTRQGQKSIVTIKNNQQQAGQTRDAFVKALYERLFWWIIEKVNNTLAFEGMDQMLSLGILDIYGFEIFDNNSFEQFCINLCNEKLQQVFIELTLRTEQEEYVKEGIEWKHIDYFDNKEICDLIESNKPKPGIIPLMDQCVLTNHDDTRLLELMNENLKLNKFYSSYLKSRDRAIPDHCFKINHYAGDVMYNINGFIEKSKDTLYQDIIDSCLKSQSPLIRELFQRDSLNQGKRPDTACTQFKTALGLLIQRLMKCNPHYVRCIKPNELKQSLNVNDARFKHQIQFLGLVENVRVRRAGFAYRRDFGVFVQRYKMISKETWPHPRTNMVDAVLHLISQVKVGRDDYRMGKTKIFIKEPATIFALESLREKELPGLATKMNSVVRGYIARKQHNRSLAVQRIITLFRWARSKKYMVDVIQTFKDSSDAKGYQLTQPWPQAPPVLIEARNLLDKVHQRAWAWSVISKVYADAEPVRTKLLAYDLFEGKKHWVPNRRWASIYLEQEGNPYKASYLKAARACIAKGGDNEICYCDVMNKCNSSYKAQLRGIVMTNMNIYKMDPKNFKAHNKPIPIAEITDITLSRDADQWVVIHTTGKQQDLLLDLTTTAKIEEEKLSEFVTVLAQTYKALTRNDLPVKFGDSTTFQGKTAKGNVNVSFTTSDGGSAQVKKDKTGLVLVSPRNK